MIDSFGGSELGLRTCLKRMHGPRAFIRLGWLGLCALSHCHVVLAGSEVVWCEDFESLAQWEPLTFDRVPRHSEYMIESAADGTSYLKMRSENAGSGLLLKKKFDSQELTSIEWRWRVDQAITQVDHRRKSGDDYPIRVYLLFDHEASELNPFEKLRRRTRRMFGGRDLPHSGLTYVWTQNPVAEATFPNPYAGRLIMRVLCDAEVPLGQWKTERIRISEEYKAAFGEAPPKSTVRLAVMSDSDDSRQRTEAGLDWIRIRSE